MQLKLQPLYKDNVTEWLPLASQCKFRLPKKHGIAARERARVVRAFSNWLSHDMEKRKAPLAHSDLDPNRHMHFLHRIYWAIRSNRPRLATVRILTLLWSDRPFQANLPCIAERSNVANGVRRC